MLKQEALDVIKEIGDCCKFLNPQEIVLQQSDNTDHYEIHIKAHVDDESWQVLGELAKKHNLGIRVTDHILVIYAPQNQRFGTLTIS